MAYYTARPPVRNYGKSSQVTISKRDVATTPWAQGYHVYSDAANLWESTETDAHHQMADALYKQWIQKKESQMEDMDPEAGAYEGNLTDEFPQQPYSVLPNKQAGRRKAGQKAYIAWLEDLKYGDLSTTILPELMTLVGNLPYKLNENGLISGKSLLSAFSKDATMLGIYVFLMLDSRSCYLTQQYKGTARPFSSLVPLIPYAIRLVKGVAYTAWDPEEIRLVINNDLADAMLFDLDPKPTRDDILEGREQGLTFASGKDVGKMRNPVTSFKLFATAGTCFEKTPHLWQVMTSQIWVAHPENRSKYMVLDPLNWDKVPPPLVSVEVFAPSAYQAEATEVYNGIL